VGACRSTKWVKSFGRVFIDPVVVDVVDVDDDDRKFGCAILRALTRFGMPVLSAACSRLAFGFLRDGSSAIHRSPSFKLVVRSHYFCRSHLTIFTSTIFRSPNPHRNSWNQAIPRAHTLLVPDAVHSPSWPTWLGGDFLHSLADPGSCSGSSGVNCNRQPILPTLSLLMRLLLIAINYVTPELRPTAD